MKIPRNKLEMFSNSEFFVAYDNKIIFILDKVVELVGEGFVINEAYPV